MVRDIDREEIKVTLSKMKNGKATGPDEIPVEVWKCLKEFEVDMLWDLMKKIHQKEKMTGMWRINFSIPMFKEKGRDQDWRRAVWIYARQKHGGCKLCTKALGGEYREGQKELHIVVIDLEKAYDRVMIWRCLREREHRRNVLD
ncbi:uncharacterized protein [Palaemon carinicauda]|uniref:uncharacterized protein n=1 Tax=Palaemon carinicauda TaxID=392227 RepID=UPI0035B60677